MSQSPASMNPVLSACMSGRLRPRELAQFASQLGHTRPEVTTAYCGTLRAHGVLPQRAASEAPTSNAD